MITDILEKELGAGRVHYKKVISHYLTLRTKTIAEYYFEAESKEDIQNAFKTALRNNIPFFFFGGGSNIAVTKDMINGLVVRNLYIRKEVLADTDNSIDVRFSSGYSIARVVAETTAAGWEGFEYHLGLPGSLGGGVAMNSKWYADRKPVYLGDSLISAILLDTTGEFKEVDRDYFKFAYDYSILKDTKEILIDAVFRLKKADPVMLKQRAKEAMEHRHKTQVVGEPTCGCMFQNLTEEEQKRLQLPTTSVGYLIDKLGLKNTQIGNFVISEKHANFFINKGEGKAADLLALITLVKTKVKEAYEVDLKEEVVII